MGVLVVLFPNLSLGRLLTVGDFRLGLSWLLSVAAGLTVSVGVSNALSNAATKALSRASRFTIFHLTNGDRKANEELAAKNKRSGQRFIANCVLAVVLNILATVLAAYFFGY